MESEEFKILCKRIDELKARIDELFEITDRDRADVTEIITSVYTTAYQHISDLYDIVHPIEDIVLPHVGEARSKIKSIVGPKKTAAGARWDKKEPEKKDP